MFEPPTTIPAWCDCLHLQAWIHDPTTSIPLTLTTFPLSLHSSHSESMGNVLSSLCTPFPANFFYELVLTTVVASPRQPALTTQDGIECNSCL